MLDLHYGRYDRADALERLIQSTEELRRQSHYELGGFRPAELRYSSGCFRVLADRRVVELSRYLLTGVDEAEERLQELLPERVPVTTFFMMSGCGPSPFNPMLGDVYLKVGHYSQKPHDREIVLHALAHEATHMYLRQVLGFSVFEAEYGPRKLLDEGFAQLCGFRAAGALKRKLAHADTCAAAAMDHEGDVLPVRIREWRCTPEERGHYPLYQVALSFVASLEREYGFATLLDVFRDADSHSSLNRQLERNLGQGLGELLGRWAADLVPGGRQEDFVTISLAARDSGNGLQFDYRSQKPLYPRKDILAYSMDGGCQLAVSCKEDLRYRTEGSFRVAQAQPGAVELIIAFDDLMQRVTI